MRVFFCVGADDEAFALSACLKALCRLGILRETHIHLSEGIRARGNVNNKRISAEESN